MANNNLHVYIDESGETGRRSRYIVFAIIATTAERKLEKIVKKLWRAKPQLHVHGELHATDSDESTIRRMLRSLNDSNIECYFSVIDKVALIESPETAYYRELDRIASLFHDKAQMIVVDKKDTDKKREKMVDIIGGHRTLDYVFFEESHKFKQLQAVDFVAWSIGRHYESNDSEYMALIDNLKQI